MFRRSAESTTKTDSNEQTPRQRRRNALRKGVATAAIAVSAFGVAGCNNANANPENTSTPPTASATETTPAPTPTAEPTEIQSPTPEATVTPEMKAQLDAMDAMPASEFEALPIEQRLTWMSSVMANVDQEPFMNKWAEWNGTPSEAYFGEPSADNTPEQAMYLSQKFPMLVAVLKDSGAWEGATAWDPNKAEKILTANDAFIYKDGVDGAINFFKDAGVFYELLQLAGSGTFPASELTSPEQTTDAQGRACYLNIVDTTAGTNNSFDLCLYDYTNYMGQPAKAWVQTAFTHN